MRLFIGFICLTFALYSCSGGASSAYDEIKKMEADITELSENLQPGEIVPEEKTNLLEELLKSFYQMYPENEHAPECLDKLHMMYSGRMDYETSARYADTLLDKYPNYVNRAMILESQASTYDIYLQPRDTSKVRYYYEMLLSEYPELPKDKREGIESRLENLHLSIEQIIMQNN